MTIATLLYSVTQIKREERDVAVIAVLANPHDIYVLTYSYSMRGTNPLGTTGRGPSPPFLYV